MVYNVTCRSCNFGHKKWIS